MIYKSSCICAEEVSALMDHRLHSLSSKTIKTPYLCCGAQSTNPSEIRCGLLLHIENITCNSRVALDLTFREGSTALLRRDDAFTIIHPCESSWRQRKGTSQDPPQQTCLSVLGKLKHLWLHAIPPPHEKLEPIAHVTGISSQ